jgi:predicted enzyme related to lactoylglutathione lyase
LFAGIQIGQHVLLDAANRGAGHLELAAPAGGQLDLDAIAQPGQGMALWLHAPDAQDIHDALAAAGTTIVSAPADGPFGRTFTFADPDGYQVTLHDRG